MPASEQIVLVNDLKQVGEGVLENEVLLSEVLGRAGASISGGTVVENFLDLQFEVQFGDPQGALARARKVVNSVRYIAPSYGGSDRELRQQGADMVMIGEAALGLAASVHPCQVIEKEGAKEK